MQTSYTDHESGPCAVTVDGALYCKSATARRPLGRSSGRRKASRNGDTYHDIDPVGIFMQLTTALAAALTAQKSCYYSWRQGRWKALATTCWVFDSALRIRVGWKNKKSWVAKLGQSRYSNLQPRMGRRGTALQSTVAERASEQGCKHVLRVRDKPSARLGACPPAFDPKLPEWPIS